MDRNQTVAAGSVDQPQPQIAHVTWIGHVLVPLVQNLLGGVAVTALGAIAVQTVTGTVTTQALVKLPPPTTQRAPGEPPEVG